MSSIKRDTPPLGWHGVSFSQQSWGTRKLRGPAQAFRPTGSGDYSQEYSLTDGDTHRIIVSPTPDANTHLEVFVIGLLASQGSGGPEWSALESSLANWWSLDHNSSGGVTSDKHGGKTLTENGNITDETGIAAGTLVSPTDRAGGWNGASTNFLSLTEDFRSADSAGAISFWFKTASGASPFNIICDKFADSSNRLVIFTASGPRIHIRSVIGGATDEIRTGDIAGLFDDAWHHCLISSSGTAWSIYVDGVLRSPTVVSGTNSGDWLGDVTGTSFYIGKNFNSSNVWSGEMDEFAVFFTAIGQSGVDELYNGGTGILYGGGSASFQVAAGIYNGSGYFQINNEEGELVWRVDEDSITFAEGSSISEAPDGALTIWASGTDPDILIRTDAIASAIFIDNSATNLKLMNKVVVDDDTDGGSIAFDNGSKVSEAADGTLTINTIKEVFVTSNSAADTPLNIKGQATQSANLTEWQLSTGDVRARITSIGGFSNNQGTTDSEAFGAGAVVSGGDRRTAFGNNARATALDTVALGRNALASAQFCIAIGDDATASATSAIAIGSDVTASGGNAVIIGKGASGTGTSLGSAAQSGTSSLAIGANSNASGTSSVAVGVAAIATGGNATAVGFQASAASNRSIAIGRDSTTTAVAQFVAGATTYVTSDVFFGSGVINVSPTSYTINGTGGSGTNIAGGNVTVAGGKGTGNAAGGQILFSTSDAGGSGTTLQSLSTKAAIVGSNLGVGTTSPAARVHADQSSATGAVPVLTLDQADISEEFIKFIGTAAEGATTQSLVEIEDVPSKDRILAGFIKINIQDDGSILPNGSYALPLYRIFNWGDYSIHSRYDASDNTNLTIVNTVVSQMTDLSGNGNHLTQATAANRPAIASFGGLQALDFDGTNDYLEIDALSSNPTAPATLMLIFATDVTNAAQTIFDGDDATDRWFMRTTAADAFRAQPGFEIGDTAAVGVGPHILAVQIDSTASTYYLNGTKVGPTNGTPDTITGITLGILQDEASNPLNGKIAEVVISDSLLKNSEINQIARHWTLKYSNLSWTDI